MGVSRSVSLSALIALEGGMNVGKTLFAQMLEFLPWKTFHRIVARYGATIASEP
jgi:hypothetical protein